MPESRARNPWPMRIVGASLFTLMLGLVSVLSEMRGPALLFGIVATFGVGLLVMMGGEVIDAWGRRWRRRSKGDDSDDD